MELSFKTKTRASKLIADTEDMLDQFFRSEYSLTPPDYYKYLREFDAKLVEAKAVVSYYEPLLEDIQFPDYGLKPNKRKAYEKFIRKILDDTGAYLSNTRAPSRPRKKKVKSAEKLVSKVKYLEAFDELKLVSVPPVHIVGANVVWLYNVKTRRLTYLAAATLDKTLTIKGTTILGFDETSSITKVIRKPETTLSELINTTRFLMLQKFQKLSTRPVQANGRISSETLILKAYK